MPTITVEGISKDEDSYLRELAEEYRGASFLDFQDIPAVQALARGLLRYMDRLTIKPEAAMAGKKVRLGDL
jgi:hypothetical protein